MTTNTDSLLAKLGLVAEFAAFIVCLGRFIWLQEYAPTKVVLMTAAWPYFAGAVLALTYVIASFVLFKKAKFRASAVLAAAMVVVLLALKFATL